MYIQYFWQGSHKIYGAYTVHILHGLANSKYVQSKGWQSLLLLAHICGTALATLKPQIFQTTRAKSTKSTLPPGKKQKLLGMDSTGLSSSPRLSYIGLGKSMSLNVILLVKYSTYIPS